MDERLLLETLRLEICRVCGRFLNEGTIRHIIEDVFLTLSPFIKSDELLWLLVESELPGEDALYPEGEGSYLEGLRLDVPRWRLANIREQMLSQGKNQRPSARECLLSIEAERNRQQNEWASRFPIQGNPVESSNAIPKG